MQVFHINNKKDGMRLWVHCTPQLPYCYFHFMTFPPIFTPNIPASLVFLIRTTQSFVCVSLSPSVHNNFQPLWLAASHQRTLNQRNFDVTVCFSHTPNNYLSNVSISALNYLRLNLTKLCVRKTSEPRAIKYYFEAFVAFRLALGFGFAGTLNSVLTNKSVNIFMLLTVC